MENRPVPLLLLALPVFFLLLGANSIWDANEAFYVETPRQMVLTGDYINPTFNGQPRFNKPVLSYWVVAGLYRAFGESVAVERAGIAAGAVGLVLATFLLGRALRSRATGVLAALFVATSPRVVIYARRIFIDVYVTFFMALALALFALAQRFPEHRRRYLLLMYAAIGLGVLTKGPVALALPALVCVLWLAVERRLGDLRRLMLVPGALIVLSIVVPWYAAIYVQHGWTYISRFIFEENLGRYVTPMAPGDRGGTFYLKVLFADLFPWAPLVAVPLVAIALQWLRPAAAPAGAAASADADTAALRRLLWLWIVVIVGVFSFSQTKQDLYIFPVAPAVAVLVADALSDDAWRSRNRAIGALFLLVCGASVAVAGGLFWVFASPAAHIRLTGAGVFAAVLALTGLAAGWLWLRRQRASAVTALAAGFVVLNYVLVAMILPGVERFKPVPPLARTLVERASPSAKIAFDNMVLPSFVYYVGRPFEELASPGQADAFLRDTHEAWVVTGEDEWAGLRERNPSLCVADERSLFLFDTKIGNILSGTPPPKILLVTNACGRR